MWRRTGVRCALIGTLLAIVGCVAPAAGAAATQQLVYHSRNSPDGLWRINLNGTGAASFIPGATWADYTADGSKLVYQVGGGAPCNTLTGIGEIEVANADGSKPVNVGAGCQPEISPDGTKVLFIGFPADGGNSLTVVNVSKPGSPKRLLSPLTSCIQQVDAAYPDYANAEGLSSSGGLVCGFPQIADWASNTEIVYGPFDAGVWKLPASGGTPAPLITTNAHGEEGSDWFQGLAVDPTGTTIAGHVTESAGSGLATLPVSGGVPKVILADPGGQFQESYGYPHWSPDGSKLALTHFNAGGFGVSRIALMNSTGGKATDINSSDSEASLATFAPSLLGKGQIAGTVTDSNGAGLPSVQVNITGSDEQGRPVDTHALTNSHGSYDVTLAAGSYKIAAVQPADPAKGRYVPSSCSGTISNQLLACQISLSAGDHATAGFKLTSDLKVTLFGPDSARSGLAVHSIHYKQAPLDFLRRDGVGELVCESGCLDTTVHVTDPQTGAPVKDALVNASVGELSQGVLTLPDGRLLRPPPLGDEVLCAVKDPDVDKYSCGSGTHLTDLKTNDAGDVFLRYWAPGVAAPVTTTLKVTVKKQCTAQDCAVKLLEASAEPKRLAIDPYLVYDKTSFLNGTEDDLLAAWADGGNAFHSLIENHVKAFDTVKHGLEFLKGLEVGARDAEKALHLFERVDPWVILLDVGLKVGELSEADEMLVMFLEKVDLSPLGLGADPFETTVSGDPNRNFTSEIVSRSQQLFPEFLRVGGGFWQATADTLRRYQKAGNEFVNDDWSVRASVFEVSHCDAERGHCGPGYANDPGNPDVANSGIQPELVFELVLMHGHSVAEVRGFKIGYDANAWTRTQPDLNDVIKDF